MAPPRQPAQPCRGACNSKTTVIRALADGEIVRRSNSIKPFLTDDNRNERLAYCLLFVNPNNMQFCDQDTRIHIDEKWFYLTRSEQTYYLAAGEAPPVRSVQSKRYISKVMFIAAVMRPIIENDIVIFDGKIDMWPFVVTEEAQRSSKNRPAGTPQMKPIGVDRATHRKMMVECVIPAIKRKLPASMRTRPLIISRTAHVLTSSRTTPPLCWRALKVDGTCNCKSSLLTAQISMCLIWASSAPSRRSSTS